MLKQIVPANGWYALYQVENREPSVVAINLCVWSLNDHGKLEGMVAPAPGPAADKYYVVDPVPAADLEGFVRYAHGDEIRGLLQYQKLLATD